MMTGLLAMALSGLGVAHAGPSCDDRALAKKVRGLAGLAP